MLWWLITFCILILPGIMILTSLNRKSSAGMISWMVLVFSILVWLLFYRQSGMALIVPGFVLFLGQALILVLLAWFMDSDATIFKNSIVP